MHIYKTAHVYTENDLVEFYTKLLFLTRIRVWVRVRKACDVKVDSSPIILYISSSSFFLNFTMRLCVYIH